METSDSECFESADEDLLSDEEDTKTVKNVSKTEDTVKKLEHWNLTESEILPNITVKNNNDPIETPKTDSIRKDDENNINTCETKEDDTGKKLDNKTNVDIEENKKIETISIETPKNKNIQKDDKYNTKTCEAEKEDTVKKLDSKLDNKTNSAEVEEIKKVEDVEENLWDDSEIDWGKEAEEEANMWDNDDWEPVEELQQKNPELKEKDSPVATTSWGSWGNWGVSSIISTATQSVSTLTQGISTVLETGMGVPEPEELARINKAEKEKFKEITPDSRDERNSSFGLGNLVMGVSHLTKLVESTGTKVISGGLDTLETIGKKTMEVLQEGDPGLKKKRAFLSIDQDKPVLSQLLREAKEKAENENKILEEKHFAKKAKNYETLFDDHQGLVHLEALEMLSKQCDIKLQSLLESYTDEALIDMQETMDQVKELCELPDEDEDEQTNVADIKDKLEVAVAEINVPISYKKLIETWDETETWLNNLKLEICDERELHQQAIETLAQLTAIAVEQFHKTGELLLVKEHRSTADEADSLVQLTTTLTSLIGVVAAKFSDKLNSKSTNSKNKDEINGLITNVFFEAANSSSYIQDAFQLLIPVLQVGAV